MIGLDGLPTSRASAEQRARASLAADAELVIARTEEERAGPLVTQLACRELDARAALASPGLKAWGSGSPAASFAPSPLNIWGSGSPAASCAPSPSSMRGEGARAAIASTMLALASAAAGDARAALLAHALRSSLGLRPQLEAGTLARGIALAEGPQHAAFFDAFLPAWRQLSDDLQVSLAALVVSHADPERAWPIAKRALEASAAGSASFPAIRALLGAIPEALWSRVDEALWRAALSRPQGHGAAPFDPRFLAAASLPAHVRAAIEAEGGAALLAQDPAWVMKALPDAWPRASAALRARLLDAAARAPIAHLMAHGAHVRALFHAMDDAALDRMEAAFGRGGRAREDLVVAAIADAWAQRGQPDRASAARARLTDPDRWPPEPAGPDGPESLLQRAEQALSEGRDSEIAAAFDHLPEDFLIRYWRVRASSPEAGRVADVPGQHLFRFDEDSHFLHADWIATLLARLGGQRALVAYGDWLSALAAEPPPEAPAQPYNDVASN